MGNVIDLKGYQKFSPPPRPVQAEPADFNERLERIRASLEKINRLMSELKREPYEA